MPFKSEKQRRYLWANEPEIARDWTDTYGSRIQKNRGGIMSMQGGMKNYLGEQEMVNAPKYWQSRPDKPPTELAYITDAEKDLIMQADIHGSLSPNVKGNYAPNEGPSGIISLDYQGDKGTYGQAGQSYGDRERPGKSSVDTGRTHHATDTPMKTSTRTVSPKDHFTQSWTGPKGLFSGGYRNLNVPGQTKHGHKSRFNPLGMLLGLINPTLGYAVSGFNTLKNIGSRYGTKLGDWREKLTGYRTQQEWEDARDERITQERISNILGRRAPITALTQRNLAKLGYTGTMPGIGTTPQSRAIAKDFNMGLNTFDGPFSTTHLQSVAKGLPQGMGITMSPDYRATQFEDMEYFGPSMTEKEFLARENLNSGIMSQVPTGTVYPGMSSLQQQFPIRPDFKTQQSSRYVGSTPFNPEGWGPWQYTTQW